MASDDRKKRERGMPWYRQHGDEVIADFKLRNCFPTDRVSEGIGFYIILKAFISKQYEEDVHDCTTITPTIAFLTAMTGLDRATATAYLTRMATNGIIQNFSMDSEDSKPEDCIVYITIDRIRDEVDEYRRQVRNNKKKEKEKMLKVVGNELKPNTDEHFKEHERRQNSIGKIVDKDEDNNS
tara:strand:- start:75 stop:620 length:546 start_codon:yes stop_codon:yes gene_type:complete